MRNDVGTARADAHWVQMVEQCCGRPLPADGLPPRAFARQAPGRLRGEGPETGPSERESLRQHLPLVARLLAARRADLLAEQEVERYVSLGWLEWHGGTLRLTTVGHNLCVHPHRFTP